MKVVIAPDSFKGSLPAEEVAAALADGVRSARPEAILDLCPMADGGEGTVRAMVAAGGGELRTARVTGPLHDPVEAEFGLLPGDPPVAVIEMASAAGLPRVPESRRDPRATTTFGVGELILAALDAGAREIVLGIGGSATVDGGAGCAQALGARFLGPDREPLAAGIAGGDLLSLHGLDLSGLDPRLRDAVRYGGGLGTERFGTEAGSVPNYSQYASCFWGWIALTFAASRLRAVMHSRQRTPPCVQKSAVCGTGRAPALARFFSDSRRSRDRGAT